MAGGELDGATGPTIYGPEGIRTAAMWRKSAASGQAAAKARRTREAASMTRVPSFNRRKRMVVNSAVASAFVAGDCIAHGEDQPVGGGVQDQAHLVGQ